MSRPAHRHFIDFIPILTKLDSHHYRTPADWYRDVQSLYTASLSAQTAQLNKDVITQLMFQFDKRASTLNISTVSEWATLTQDLFQNFSSLLIECPYQFLIDSDLTSLADSNSADFPATPAHVARTAADLRALLRKPRIPNPEEDLSHCYLGAFRDKVIDLDDFRKIREIGSGAFARVTLEEHLPTGRQIAIKTLKGIGPTKRRLECFCREVWILAHYRHQCLLPFFGFTNVGRSGADELIIATDFMKHGTLRELLDLEACGRAPPCWDATRKSAVAYGVACGMNFLHACRVVHRDLKSLNILLDENYEPKIADLGLAKFVHEGEVQTMKIGSYPWMAPEVLSSNFYNEKADIYSFAMILYEMATLRFPFGECRQTEIPPRVLSGKRPALDGVPRDVAALIARCWKQNPRERPSFAEIVAEFNDERCLFPDTRRDYFGAIRFKMEKADADFKMNLIVAAENNFGELVRAMIENGYEKVNEVDGDGRTALHIAIIHGAAETVQALLDCPAVDVNAADGRRVTALHQAVLSGSEAALRRLTLRHDLAMNPRDRDRNTPLHLAVARHFEGGIALLVARQDTHVNSVNATGDTPLTLAVGTANRLAVQRLSGTGRLKMVTPQHRPLLHRAIGADDVETARLLTAIPGINVNVAIDGRTPLELAAMRDSPLALMCLLSLPQIDASPPVLSRLLAQSIRGGRLCLLRLAVAMGADVNFGAEEVAPPIVTAAAANNVEAVAILATSPLIDVNAREVESGFTALHYAAQNANPVMIKCLMGVPKVNPAIENNWHQTPKMLTQSRSMRKLLKVSK